MDPTPFLVDNPEALERFIAEWLPAIEGVAVGLDIEEDRMRHYNPDVSLIQLTCELGDAVLDPMAFELAQLLPLVEAICLTPSRMVMHGARNDVGGLKRDFGVGPGALADTQIAARFAGEEAFGLAPLIEKHFGITLDKSARRSDWGKRPLKPRQVAYAAADTHHLLPLWDTLYATATDRGWQDAVDEECAAMGELPADKVRFDPHGWRRLSGMRAADPRVQGRAHALWAWRDRTAQALDWQASRLMPPRTLARVAASGPSMGFQLRGKARSHQDELDAILERRSSAPSRPRNAPRHTWSRAAFERRLDALLAWRQRAGQEAGIEVGFLAPRGLLEEIARLEELTDEALRGAEARQWRIVRYAEQWRTCLK